MSPVVKLNLAIRILELRSRGTTRREQSRELINGGSKVVECHSQFDSTSVTNMKISSRVADDADCVDDGQG
jgi:hypothetical protein